MNIPLFKIFSDEEDIEAVKHIIQRGTYWADGPEIVEFENKLTEYVGQKHAVAFNNGTSALHALMLAYDIGPGDEVIVPSFSFISTANAPLFTGAKPVFADIEPDYFGLDPEKVKERITDNTKAIIPVHYGGHSCHIDALKDIAEDNNILLLEDAAEALGSKLNGKMVGTFGDAAMFSFCQNKVITTGEGGAILTEDQELAQKLQLLRSHGRASADYFSGAASDYVSIGYNLRMPTMSAALGISQLNKIEKIISMRRELAKVYGNRLLPINGISPPKELDSSRHIFQLYTAILEDGSKRDGLKKHLAKNNVASKVYFDPIHLSKFFRPNYGNEELPVTQDIASRVLTLPLYPGLRQDEINGISDLIEEYLGD